MYSLYHHVRCAFQNTLLFQKIMYQFLDHLRPDALGDGHPFLSETVAGDQQNVVPQTHLSIINIVRIHSERKKESGFIKCFVNRNLNFQVTGRRKQQHNPLKILWKAKVKILAHSSPVYRDLEMKYPPIRFLWWRLDPHCNVWRCSFGEGIGPWGLV